MELIYKVKIDEKGAGAYLPENKKLKYDIYAAATLLDAITIKLSKLCEKGYEDVMYDIVEVAKRSKATYSNL